MEEKELPEGWVSSTLGALGEYINGYAFNERVWSKSGRPIIRIQDLTGTAKITNFYDKEMEEKYIVYPGDLLVAWSATLGAFIWKGPEACLNQHIFKVVSHIERIFHYYLIQNILNDLYREAHGSGIVHIIRSKFEAMRVLLPPLPEQQRIVEAIEQQFSRLDSGVALLRQAQKRLKLYRASVLKAAVEGVLTAEWRVTHPDVEPASELLKRILAERRAKWEEEQVAKGRDLKKAKYVEPIEANINDLPEIPNLWSWIRVEQVCDFITKGTTPSAEKLYNGAGDIPFIKVYNLTHSGSLDFGIKPTFVDYHTHTSELTRSKVFPGDILMNIVGPPLGKVSIIPNIYPEWNINQAIALFRPMPSYNKKFLAILLMTKHILDRAVRRAKTTAGQHNLTLEICRDLPLPLPPLAEQEQIVTIVEERLSIISELEATIERSLKIAERQRQSILHQAFSGKLVPQDPDDEPASVLLERIRQERAQQTTREHTRSTKTSADKPKKPTRTAQPVRIPDGPIEPLDSDELAQKSLWSQPENTVVSDAPDTGERHSANSEASTDLWQNITIQSGTQK